MKKNLLLWLFFVALLTGTSYNTYVHYDFTHSTDSQTYMAIAKLDFENQSLFRRYRVTVPVLANVFSTPFSWVAGKFWQHRNNSDWFLRLGFLFVNLSIMGLLGVILVKIGVEYGSSLQTSIVATIAVLMSRWANYASALPLVDSFYFLIVATTVLSIKQKNNKLLIISILLGPFAKESYIFVAPIVLLLSNMHKIKLVLWFVLSGILVFGLRFWIDTTDMTNPIASISHDLTTVDLIKISLQRIFSAGGIGEIFTVLGLFSFVILLGFTGGKQAIQSWWKNIDKLLIFLLVSVCIQALFSTSIARMLYVATPLWVVALAHIYESHPLFVKIRGLFLK